MIVSNLPIVQVCVLYLVILVQAMSHIHTTGVSPGAEIQNNKLILVCWDSIEPLFHFTGTKQSASTSTLAK